MVRTGEWISKGWNMVFGGPHVWMFMLLGLIYNVLLSAASSTGVGFLLLYGP